MITVTSRASGEGKLFGSVTTPRGRSTRSRRRPASISIAGHLHLDEPIKTIGTHEVAAKLHPEVQFQITVEVSAS